MGFCEMLSGAIGGAAISSAVGAASGAAGAKMLEASGHAGYDVLAATQMGAAGNAALGALVGAVAGGSFSFFADTNKALAPVAIPLAVGKLTLGGVIGYGMFLAAGASTMELPQTAASLASGSAVIVGGIAVTVGLLCCLSICCCGAFAFGMTGAAAASTDTPMKGLGA